MNTVVGLVDFLAKASIYDILPSQVRRLTGFSLRGFHKQLDDLNKFMHNKVEEHKKNYNKNAATNFVDAWLQVFKSYFLLRRVLAMYTCCKKNTKKNQIADSKIKTKSEMQRIVFIGLHTLKSTTLPILSLSIIHFYSILRIHFYISIKLHSSFIPTILFFIYQPTVIKFHRAIKHRLSKLFAEF